MDKYLCRKDVYDEIMLKSFGLDAETIEKARGLPDGTIREWSGKKYKKTNGKWLPVGKGEKGSAEEPAEIGSVKFQNGIKSVEEIISRNPGQFNEEKTKESIKKVEANIERMKKDGTSEDIVQLNQGRLKALKDHLGKLNGTNETAKPKHSTGDIVTLDGAKGDFKVSSIDKDGTYHVVSVDGKKGYKVSENHILDKKSKDPESASNKADNQHDKKYGSSALWEQKIKNAIKSGDNNKIKETLDQITKEHSEMSKTAKDNTKGFIDAELNKVKRLAGEEKPKKQLEPIYGRKQIPASEFSAAKYKEEYDDDKVDTTYDGIQEGLRQASELPIIKRHPEFMMKLRNDLMKAEKEPETVTKYRKSGEGAEAIYTPERTEIHQKIINRLITEKLKAAKPKDGEQPTFQILGGRGGSGKSTFNKKKSDAGVYNEDNVIVVDPDALKQELAKESGDGWEGWKAKAYHEESSDVSKMLMKNAMALGLNIVMDITMSNADTQIDELKLARTLGYKTGAYYMHVPKQESFKRAMKRYVESETEKGVEDFSGRLVPPDVLLGMTGNEANFDKVKEFADDWSFYDNFIPFEKDEKTGKNKYQAEKIAQKGE